MCGSNPLKSVFMDKNNRSWEQNCDFSHRMLFILQQSVISALPEKGEVIMYVLYIDWGKIFDIIFG